LRGCRGTREQETAGGWVVVDGAPDEIPRTRHALPFIDENGRLTANQALWVGAGHGSLLGVVQTVGRASVPFGGTRLADRLRALEGNGRQECQEVSEVLVNDPIEISISTHAPI